MKIDFFEMTLSNVEDKELVIYYFHTDKFAGYKSMDIEPDKMMIMEILSTQVSKGELD
jgi:hypothetical protein